MCFRLLSSEFRCWLHTFFGLERIIRYGSPGIVSGWLVPHPLICAPFDPASDGAASMQRMLVDLAVGIQRVKNDHLALLWLDHQTRAAPVLWVAAFVGCWWG